MNLTLYAVMMMMLFQTDFELLGQHLGMRCVVHRSIVRCSVGDKPAIAICSLSVKELTCQLELEFEESNDVVFSVMGPRGVYLAGYLVAASVSGVCQHSVHKGQEKTTVEISDCSDQVLHKDGVESSQTAFSGLNKESIDAQNTGIGQAGRNIKGGNRLLKCSGDKNIEGNIITLNQKTRKDGNKGCNNEDQEKLIAVKTHSVFGTLLEKKSEVDVLLKRRR